MNHRMIMARLALAACLTIAGGTAKADPPPNLPQNYTPPLPAPSDRATRDFPGGVKMFGDITYEVIPGYRPLMLDLYLPPHPAADKPLPLVIWIHGGGYEIGNPRADWTYGDWSTVLARLAARGYVVAGVAYRFKREAPFPAQYDDVHTAIGFLRDHAAQWNIDSNRVYAWGLSAGGHMAALLGTRSAGDEPRYRVQGVVDWFGPTDFNSLDRPGAKESHSVLLGCQGICPPQRFAEASPVTYVSPLTPPVLIVQGVDDHLVPVAQSDEFYARLKAANVPVTYQRLPGLDHGFVGADKLQLEKILQDTWHYLDKLAGK